MRLKIAGGRVYDPAQGWEGEVRDLYLDGERLVSSLPEVDQVLDAAGHIVVPGGVELRGQVATFGLNFLRLWGGLPPPAEAAKRYAALGYTHVHEPFLTTGTAGAVHQELAALPLVDTSASLVLNCRDLDGWLKDPARLSELAETVRFFLEQTRSVAVRVVEPWVRHRQEFYRHRALGVEEALEVLARLAEEMGLLLQVEASPEVLGAAWPEGAAFHLAGVGQALADEELAAAAAAKLQQVTSSDMGLIFPQGSGGLNGQPVWVEVGLSRPFNLAPPRDRDRARRALELALRFKGSNLAFSGAGAFQASVAHYHHLLGWLRDAEVRERFWGDALGAASYSLQEWVYATRTLPARILGLEHCGHFRPGARADVALFDAPAGGEGGPAGLGPCRTLLKGGRFVIRDYTWQEEDIPRGTWYRRTGAVLTAMAAELCGGRSFRPEHLPVPAQRENPAFREVPHGQP